MMIFLKRFAFGAQASGRFTCARANVRRRKSALMLGVLLAISAFAGCKSASLSQYVSPRVEGRVLNAESRQPIEAVKVHRGLPGQAPAADPATKGAELLERTPAIRSRKDGTFVMASERGLDLFRQGGWYSVTLSFEHAGYASFTTNYTLANATNTPGGEPLVRAGNILLAPLPR